MSEAQVLPFGTWPSPISAERVARATVSLAEVRLDGEATTWLEGRPGEQGRYVIVRAEPGSDPVDVTPPGFSARTRVHEYGGGAYAVRSGLVLFANDEDQRVHRQEPGTAPSPITPQPPERRSLRYADLDLSPDGTALACVRERHGDGLPANELVLLPADGSDEPRVLATGRDFYAFPRWSPDGASLAWIEWDMPNMPWDGTELKVAPIVAGVAGPVRSVAGGLRESIFQPAWDPRGRLHFVSDLTEWWNLYREETDGSVSALTPVAAEFAVPMWEFGLSTYAFLADGRIACLYRRRGEQRLALLDPDSLEMLDLDLPFACFEPPSLRGEGMRLAFVAGGPTTPPQVVTVDLVTRAVDVISVGEPSGIDPEYLSEPRPIEFATPSGTAYAYHYPPTNPQARAPEGERPPLLVHVHGGPTSEVTPELDLEKQYFTSRGFALVDVNYAGSTGHGRAFRELLYGRWGEVDVQDAVAATAFLVERGLADPARLLIDGGSAGGWTTLCALTFTDAFAAGASYFGVSDLEPFATFTHKFELKYMDLLVGPWPEAAERWHERSPARHAELISRPLLILQGDEDEVVPPSQAEAIVQALERNEIPHAYLLFEGEQHGFRKAESIVRALEAELAFFGLVLGFEPADDLPPLDVRHLPTA